MKHIIVIVKKQEIKKRKKKEVKISTNGLDEDKEKEDLQSPVVWH